MDPKYLNSFKNCNSKYYPCYLLENTHGADMWVCSKESKTMSDCMNYWDSKGTKFILDYKVLNRVEAWKEWFKPTFVTIWEK